MTDERIDDIEIRRVLAAPFANGRELRDAVEVVINGERLSDLLDGVAIDVFMVRRELAGPWTSGGARVPVGVCGCGDTGCIGAFADIERRGPLVEWSVLSLRRRFVFDAAELEREIRRALSEPRSSGSSRSG